MAMKANFIKRSVCVGLILILSGITSCRSTTRVTEQDQRLSIREIPPGMSLEEVETLSSLKQIDPYPLYTMHFKEEYDIGAISGDWQFVGSSRIPAWGCSLFAVYGDPENILFGRNFDWDFSPALILFTYPPDGYASVSIVDIAYLGYGEDFAFGLTDLPMDEQAGLLNAPYLPFDGMNQAGIAVGMASVPDGGMVDDPAKETIDSLMVMRIILDEAATVDEAVEIIKRYNIDMESGPPLHYLVADRSGRSALVEFSKGEVIVIPNSDPWQQATNFLVSETRADPEMHCRRYGLIAERLAEYQGILSSEDAMELLEDVTQGSTQWSVVYGMSSGEIDVVMGGNYQDVQSLRLSP